MQQKLRLGSIYILSVDIHYNNGYFDSVCFLFAIWCLVCFQATEAVLGLGEEFFHSPEELQFHAKFSKELSKNDKFRTFVRNFEAVYDGQLKTECIAIVLLW